MFDNTDNSPSNEQLEAHFSNYDPLAFPSPVEVVGHPNLPDRLSITMFDKDVQNEIRGEVAKALPHQQEALEAELVQKAAEANSLKFRSKVGLGRDATETQKSDAETANRVRLLQEESKRIQAALDEARMIVDPVTGEQIDSGDKRLKGDQRSAYQTRLNEIGHEMSVLVHLEGPKRRSEAVQADIARFREQQEAIADEREARALAEKIVREERIQARAEARAKSLRSNIG